MKRTAPQFVFMFAGQGSHYPGMGKTLYEQYPVFRDWMHRLDDVARTELQESVIDRLYVNRKKSAVFDETEVTHPAIFMVEYALAQTLISLGITPDLVFGASLGEAAAAALAGMIDVEDCLMFVIKQAKVFDELCPRGGMMAVFDSPHIYATHPQFNGPCVIAAVNGPRHFVVSGSVPALEESESFLRARGIVTSLLPVSHAFHSPFIAPAKQAFLALSYNLRVNKPRIPMFSCAWTDFINDVSRDYFWEVVRRPIKAMDAIRKLSSTGKYVYLDVSPSGTLFNFIKYHSEYLQPSQSFFVLQPFGDESARLRSVVCDVTAICSERKAPEMKNIAYIFPGQGSQFKGMGKTLFDQFPDMTSKADAILGYSIKELCVDDPNGKLSLTEYTQPAIYVVSVLSYLRCLGEGAPPPDYCAGHSLGEYTALFVAGVFDFATGLKLVQKRGALMSAASEGGMAAILQLNHSTVDAVIRENGLSALDVANFNAPQQTVVAGPLDELDKAQQHFEKAGGKFMRLKVSAPFHSRYMAAAAAEFAEFLESFELGSPKIPVISNVLAKPYGTSPSQIKANLTKQITSPVRWVETVWYLMRYGITSEFKEIGPGEVLTKLVAAICRHEVPDDFSIEEQKPPAARTRVKPIVRTTSEGRIDADNLGSYSFKHDYGVRGAYVAGSMYMGISSKELVVRMAKSGYLGFFGTGGLALSEIAVNLQQIKSELSTEQPFGMNLLFDPANPALEMDTVRLFLKHEVTCVEASAFMHITPALVLFRLKGLSRSSSGDIVGRHKIIAKISRPEVARGFLEPSPSKIIEQLLIKGYITPFEAELGRKGPVATDLCVEADSGGHTDRAVMSVLLPTIIRLRDRVCTEYGYREMVRVGAAGGIGTPEAAGAAFLLGADFVLTGSINQCTCEAGTSDLVKDMLQKIDIQDTDYAPAGDTFEMGSKVQVMKRSVFFPARANKLYELWKNHRSIEDIDEKDRIVIQEKYFRKSFDEVYADVRNRYGPESTEVIRAGSNPKHRMALIFKAYFAYGTRSALDGEESNRVNFQVQCGPALGAFNQWVKGTELEDWHKRHVDDIADKIMAGAAYMLNNRFEEIKARDIAYTNALASSV